MKRTRGALFGEPERFILGDGAEPMTQRAYHYHWSKLEKQIPQLETVTSHALRHTFATIASTNTDIKTLQSILGHSKADITLMLRRNTAFFASDCYQHLFNDLKSFFATTV